MVNKLQRIVSLARIFIIDGLRRHAIIGLVVLSIAAEIGALLFMDFIPRDIGRASSDFLLSMAWFAGFVFLFFHGVQVAALDEEKKVIYSFLARPISRGEYVIGIFVGLAGLLFLLNVLLGGLAFATLMVIKGMVEPQYFSHFNLSYYLLSWGGLFFIELMLLAMILFFSGLVRGSFPVLLISLAFYGICSGVPVVREAINQQVARSDGATALVNSKLHWLTAIFPDFNRLDYKNMITVAAPPPDPAQLLVNFGLAVTYIGILMWFACLVYQRRDLQ